MIAVIHAALPPGTMAKALISLTEAKTCALEELAVPSRYHGLPATGTGTDGAIVICDPASPVRCIDSGTHSKLGELLCTAVRNAVRKSLALECSMTPASQGSVPARLARLGLTTDDIGNLALSESEATVLLAQAERLLYELQWQLLRKEDVLRSLSHMHFPAQFINRVETLINCRENKR